MNAQTYMKEPFQAVKSAHVPNSSWRKEQSGASHTEGLKPGMDSGLSHIIQREFTDRTCRSVH